MTAMDQSGATSSANSSVAKQKRQLFPEKLWELVHSQQSSGIRWSASNSKCIEIDRSKLERYLQTKFRSQNFDSFIRQLHFYGFKKCGNSYFHDKFQRDQPDGIHKMRRKYSLNMLAHPAEHRNVAASDHATDNNIITTNTNATMNTCTTVTTTDNINITNALQRTNATKLLTPNTAPSSNLAMARKSSSKLWKEIKLYTVRSTGDDRNFSNINEANARAFKDSEGHLRISIPKSLVTVSETNNSIGPWPRSLVLECYKSGEQSILSAFFVYRL